jgi:murein DD-endopeptidase MepM/ murein hydrolase activator NlpD
MWAAELTNPSRATAWGQNPPPPEPPSPAGGEQATWALGNHVIIRHDDAVHCCLAHLRFGSVTVTVGQEVAAGTPVGAVGRSGHAIGPHLHLHFMDGPDVIRSAPLPIKLAVEGETYAPVSGQIIGP